MGTFIKARRQAALLSQEELAIKAGVTVRTIWSLEAGGTDPQFKTLRKIASALGIPAAEFIAPDEVAS